jgi:molybdate transport system ATP-binding protein
MKLVFEKVALPLSDFALELDFSLETETLGLFGRSGAGKTSLLDLIAGVRRPARGRIILDDVVLIDCSARSGVPSRERGMGYVSQEGALFPHFSVEENLRYGEKRKGAAMISFNQVVSVLALQSLLQRRIAHLSGGERQRVALGRALLSSPRLLLLDVPLSSLDATLREETMELLEQVRNEFQVPWIYVSHAPWELQRLCIEILVLDRGRVIRRGSVEKIFTVGSEPVWRLRQDN